MLFEIICGFFLNVMDVFKIGIVLRKKKEMRIKKKLFNKYCLLIGFLLC